jgi:hypothetical protein
MAEVNPMVAVNDTITVALSKMFNGALAAVLSGGVNPVGVTAVVELSADDQATWEIATLNKPNQTTMASFTTGLSGWCEAPGYTHARIRLTAIASGSQGGRITPREG